MLPPSSIASLSLNGTSVGPTAAVERAHSDRARSGSKGSARVSFHPFHRGGSASKKATSPLPPLFNSSLRRATASASPPHNGSSSAIFLANLRRPLPPLHCW